MMPVAAIVAQTDNADLGLWTSIEANTKLAQGVGLSMEAEYRMRDHISTTDRTSFGVSLSYKNKNLAPWLKADVGYTFIYKNNPAETTVKYMADGITPKHKNDDAAYWGAKHRATASLNGSFKAGRWKIGLRERYQFTYRAAANCERTRWYYNPFYEFFPEEVDEWYLEEDPESAEYSFLTDSKSPKADNKLRSRLSASYNIKHSKFEPFAELEIYTNIDNTFAIDKIRYTFGTDYKLSKTSKLSAYYRYQDQSDEDEVGGHVIGIGYSFDF